MDERKICNVFEMAARNGWMVGADTAGMANAIVRDSGGK